MESNILDLLEPYIDAIMVDKGFCVEQECLNHAIDMIRPPFLRAKKQLSEAQSKATADIARARVHVERTIQRIKPFAILRHRLPFSMLCHANQIMAVVCGITNLSAPVLADDKF